ncbi:MAG: hypothetical protein IRZ21_03280 [Thermoleophilaceae bacterium]|nr:hypothetical protein [Thermoleophilaceae bacterium]
MRGTKAVVVALPSPRAGRWPLAPLPRELAPAANTPVLVRQLEALRDAGMSTIAVVGAQALTDAVRGLVGGGEDLGVEVVTIAVPAGAGPAESLLGAEPFVEREPFVLEIAGSLVEHDLRGTVEALDRRRRRGIVVTAPEPLDEERVVELEERRAGGPPRIAGLRPASVDAANLLVLDAAIFAAIRRLLERSDRPEPGLAEAVQALAEAHGGVEAQPVGAWSLRIDGIDDLLDANRRVLGGIAADHRPESLHESSVVGTVAIGEGARVEYSLLRGPIAVGPGARVADAYIGPYTSIGAGATVEGVELEHSIVLPGASIEQLPARLDGSVIGENARVCRRVGVRRTVSIRIGGDAEVALG